MWPVVPTKRLWLLAAFGLLLTLGGAAFPGLEKLALPYDVGLLVLFWSTGSLARKWDVLQVRRTFDPVMSVRQQNTVTLILESLAPVDLLFKIRDEPPPTFAAQGNEFELRLAHRQEASHDYWVVPSERGNHEFSDLYVSYGAPLGLARVQKAIPTPQQAHVYPNVKAVREFDFLKQKGRLREAGVRQTRSKGLGTEFESLREYNDDDFRLIDWKSTARRGRLVVKNFEQERNQAVMVCLDLGRHMLGEVGGVSKIDHALDAAIMVFHAAERAGDMVGLYAFNDAVRAYVAPRRGKTQVSTVLKAAHALFAEPVQPDYTKALTYLSTKWKKRSLIVFFTDAENEDQANNLAAALAHVRRHHLLMIVRVKDPKLNELLNLPFDTPDDLFSRSAATWYQSDRMKAASVFAASGIHSIESEPDELAATLVNAYLRAKRLALL